MDKEAKSDSNQDSMQAPPSMMTRQTRERIVSLLKTNQHDEADIFEAIDDVNARLAWKPQSLCFVFSRKKQAWLEGQVAHTFVDDQTNEEWLSVKYGKNSKKRMQRFCTDIKPINAGHDYQFKSDVVLLIIAELKQVCSYKDSNLAGRLIAQQCNTAKTSSPP